MNSKVTYLMEGFNIKEPGYCRKMLLKNNKEYIYKNHSFLKSVSIDDEFKHITFTLLPDKNVKEFLNEIGNELERICFNIIAYSDVSTCNPVCFCEKIIDKNGNEEKIELHDQLKIRDSVSITATCDATDFFEEIMSQNTPISEHKAQYKELFFILHNPHRVIQFIALYDVLLGLICSSDERNKQQRVHDFFGKNKERYPYIDFKNCNNNPNKKEDMFTHLRNIIAHSQNAGIEEFSRVAASITPQYISLILRVINDILSGVVTV